MERQRIVEPAWAAFVPAAGELDGIDVGSRMSCWTVNELASRISIIDDVAEPVCDGCVGGGRTERTYGFEKALGARD